MDGTELLRRFLVDHMERLCRKARSIILRAHVAQGTAADEMAREVYQDLFVQAIQGGERFDPARPPMAWLYGTMVNLVRQRRDAQGRSRRIESLDEKAEIFDRLAAVCLTPEQELSAKEDAQQILNLASKEERQVLELALVRDMSGEEVARELGVSQVTARVRLYRAIRRLRDTMSHQAGRRGR